MGTIICWAILAVGPIPSERAAALEAYHARRQGTPVAAGAQMDLARWCEANGLIAEAQAHLTVVTRIEPGNVEARAKLGQARFEGRWMPAAAIDQLREDRKVQAEADRRYRPWLESWRGWIHSGGKRDLALAALDPVSDPRAVPSIRVVFGQGDARDQSWAVRMYVGIDSPEATLSLVSLALRGRAPWLQKMAFDALEGRDARVYVGLLINRLIDPVRYEVLPSQGPEEVGELWIERPGEILDRVYDAPGRGALPSSSSSTVALIDSTGTSRRFRQEVSPDVSAIRRGDGDASARAEARLRGDALALERDRFAVDRVNDRLLQVLRLGTGQDLGPDKEAWTSWWTNELGYSYRSPHLDAPPKPVIVQHISAPQPVLPPPIIRNRAQPAGLGRSCFAGGTLVRAEAGLRPIESLAVGDLVLSLDTTTGASTLRPIIATYHNPPSATLAVSIAGDTIVATAIHRFWHVSRGWTMARDLRPGDVIRVASGEGRVESVTPDVIQPVFNLEVLGDRDFFVGRVGALVHDNSIAPPTGKGKGLAAR